MQFIAYIFCVKLSYSFILDDKPHESEYQRNFFKKPRTSRAAAPVFTIRLWTLDYEGCAKWLTLQTEFLFTRGLGFFNAGNVRIRVSNVLPMVHTVFASWISRNCKIGRKTQGHKINPYAISCVYKWHISCLYTNQPAMNVDVFIFYIAFHTELPCVKFLYPFLPPRL